MLVSIIAKPLDQQFNLLSQLVVISGANDHKITLALLRAAWSLWRFIDYQMGIGATNAKGTNGADAIAVLISCP